MSFAQERSEVVVIGAGVVGLAVARTMAMQGHETLILEAAEAFGTGISSRNSEVIHAGIYYPHDSMKARFCVAGRDLLYAFCAQHGVAHRRCGKLIVATAESQLAEMDRIRAAAATNGVELTVLTAAQAQAMEPQLKCAAALHSPLTGIVDSHEYMLALLGQAENHGATLACNSRVTGMHLASPQRLTLEIDGAPAIEARLVINCAGLNAPALAGSIRGFPAERVPKAYFAKGNYFTLAGRSPFQRLIYPMPEPGGLGIHLTLDLAGRARFGPDVQWIEEHDYTVDPRGAEKFYGSIRTYWPALPDGALLPGYAGIRPKLSGRGEPNADFRIEGRERHGIAAVINLFGIESPGLTSSLAIAAYVGRMAEEQLG